MSRFRLACLAITDLAEIREYVARDKPKAADRLIRGFFEKFHMLANNAELGEERPEFGCDLRSFSVGSYVIFYRPAVEGIEVARILSGFRDVEPLF